MNHDEAANWSMLPLGAPNVGAAAALGISRATLYNILQRVPAAR